MQRGVFIVSALVFLSSLPCFAQRLALSPLKGEAASLHWSAPQFIQADTQGNVFLLRGEPLEIYPVTKSHDLGEPVRIDGPGSAAQPLDAAMSPDGEWVFIAGPEIHLVANAHATRLPQVPWLPVSVGFLNGDPVAGVMPPRMVRGDGTDDPKIPPLLMRIGHDSWGTELREAALPMPDNHWDIPAERASRAVLMLGESNGRYFLARQYAYRIELRRTGREAPLEELRLGKGEVILKGGAESGERLTQQIKAEGLDMSGMAASAFHGVLAILALTHGPGGRLYALVAPGVAGGAKCALDRIEWDARRVERVSLALPCEGRVSLAAGRDGLYFAGYSGEDGRFFASWDELETAKWTPVKEAKFGP